MATAFASRIIASRIQKIENAINFRIVQINDNNFIKFEINYLIMSAPLKS